MDIRGDIVKKRIKNIIEMIKKKTTKKRVIIGVGILLFLLLMIILFKTGIMKKLFSNKAVYGSGSEIEYADSALNDGDDFVDVSSGTLSSDHCSEDGKICIVVTKIRCNSSRGKIEYSITNTSEVVSSSSGGDNTEDLDDNSVSGYFRIIIGDNSFYGRYVNLEAGETKNSYIRYADINLKDTTDYTFELLGEDAIDHYIDPIDDGIVTTDFIYAIGANSMGQELSGGFENFAAAKEAFGHPVTNAYIVNNEKIAESYVAYERDGQLYHFRGGVDETEESDHPVYDNNVMLIKEMVGDNWSDSCTETETEGILNFLCNVDDLSVTANSFGSIQVGSDSWRCYVYGNGLSSCN